MIKDTCDENAIQAAEAADAKQRDDRARSIVALEREYPARQLNYPDDMFDFEIWTDDDIINYFDTAGLQRPAPRGVDREGHGSFWPCSVCHEQKNRDPAGREVWEGARVEAAASGGRLFTDGIVVKVRQPQPDAFGDLDPAAKVSYDVRFDTGKRENIERDRVRFAVTCKVRSFFQLIFSVDWNLILYFRFFILFFIFSSFHSFLKLVSFFLLT